VLHCNRGALHLIQKFVLTTDGDYVVCLFHKQLQTSAIFNDALGRLPLYYTQTDTRLIVTRELRFITGIYGSTKIDKMGIAQFLLFGYPLAKRTLLETIFRVPAATVCSMDLCERKIDTRTFHQFNFELKPHSRESIEDNAARLEFLFSTACVKRQSPNGRTILSLSGGLDSRSVAASLHKNNIPFFAKTFLDWGQTAARDAAVAEKIARILGSRWTLVRLDLPSGQDLMRLLKTKNGLNPLRMAFIMPFLEHIRREHSSDVILFTGDGGDKALHDLRVGAKIKSSDALVDRIIAQNYIVPLKQAASLAGVDPNEIITDISDHINTYPEESSADKYVHFLLYERAFKWLFEGEDRNRFYFWSVTPFYSIEFFQYAMGCPDNQKSSYDLYRHFLTKLSTSVAHIENANWRVPLTGHSYLAYSGYRSIVNKLPTGLKQRIKSRLRTNTSSVYADVIREQYNKCWGISDLLHWAAVEHFLRNCREQRQIEILFTVTAYLEELICGQSSIQSHLEKKFT
jgi:asparagine synthase (glutamine-hydrolysing)